MAFVVDASVTGAWCFPDESDSGAEALLDRLGEEPGLVPGLWWYEIRNILIVNERRGRIDAAGSAAFLADLGHLPIEIDQAPESSALLALARRHRLSAYDAAYLELAARTGTPIDTTQARTFEARPELDAGPTAAADNDRGLGGAGALGKR